MCPNPMSWSTRINEVSGRSLDRWNKRPSNWRTATRAVSALPIVWLPSNSIRERKKRKRKKLKSTATKSLWMRKNFNFIMRSFDCECARVHARSRSRRKEVIAIDTSIFCVRSSLLTHTRTHTRIWNSSKITPYLARDLHKVLHVLFLSPITATKRRTRQIEFKTRARRGSTQEHEKHAQDKWKINHTVRERAYGDIYIYVTAA